MVHCQVLSRIFRVFDLNGDGVISTQEMSLIIKVCEVILSILDRYLIFKFMIFINMYIQSITA